MTTIASVLGSCVHDTISLFDLAVIITDFKIGLLTVTVDSMVEQGV